MVEVTTRLLLRSALTLWAMAAFFVTAVRLGAASESEAAKKEGKVVIYGPLCPR